MRDGKLGSKINKRPRRFGGSRSMTNTKIVVLLEKIRKFFRIYKSGANETLQRQKDKSFIIIISQNEIYFIFYFVNLFSKECTT